MRAHDPAMDPFISYITTPTTTLSNPILLTRRIYSRGDEQTRYDETQRVVRGTVAEHRKTHRKIFFFAVFGTYSASKGILASFQWLRSYQWVLRIEDYPFHLN